VSGGGTLVLILAFIFLVSAPGAATPWSGSFPTPRYPAFFRSPYRPLPEGWLRGSPILDRAERAFRRGLETGNFLPAISLYRDALREDPDAPWRLDAFWRIAEGYQRMRHFHEAVSAWRKVIRLGGSATRVLAAKAALAECLFRAGWYTEALEQFQEVRLEELPPGERIWTLNRMGDCLLALGRVQEAQIRYLQADACGEEAQWIPPESLTNKARLALWKRMPRKAGWALMTALSLYPLHPWRPRWLYLLGEARLMEGKRDEALVVWEDLIRQASTSLYGRLARLRITTVVLRYGGGPRPPVLSVGAPPEEWLNPRHPIYHLDPYDPYLHRTVLKFAEALHFRQQDEEAFQVLANGLKGFDSSAVTPTFRKLLGRLALRLILDGKLTDPSQVLEVFAVAAPWADELWRDPAVLMEVGQRADEAGFQRFASSLFKRAYKGTKDPNLRSRAAVALVRVQLALGRTEEARAWMERIPSKFPWRSLGKKLIQWVASTGNAEDRTALAAWFAEAPHGKWGPSSLVLMGRWFLLHGEEKDGIAILQKTLMEAKEPLKVRGRWAEAWCLLGDLLLREGKVREAMECYQRVAEEAGGEPPGLWAAYQLVRLGGEGDTAADRDDAYLDRLLKQPPGSLWRRLALAMTAPERLSEGKGG